MAATLTSPDKVVPTVGQEYLAGLDELLRYYRKRGLEGEDLTEPEAQFALALARYRFAPPPGKMIHERFHVMVFGGAGAGKSTMTNIVVGAPVAEINPQAGYTRHPVALFRSDSKDPDDLWPDRLGTLERYDGMDTYDVDEDRFSWRRLEIEVADPGFLRRHVAWDCPDLTTKDATHYQSRVIEIAALADVAIYVASDERYNDELPTNFLQAMLDAGKWVVVTLTKASSCDADEFVRLFQEQVVSQLSHPERIVATIAVPSPDSGVLADLWNAKSPYGQKIREAIERVTGDFAAARFEARKSAGDYLSRLQARLLEPLRRDLGEWQAWVELVRKTANEAVLRFEREHLAVVDYKEFREAQGRLQSVFQLPGFLQYFWQGLEVLRTPYRWARSLVARFTPSFVAEQIDDDRALDRVRRGMLETLQVACAARKNRHRLWKELRDAIEHESAALIEPTYHQTRDRHRRDIHHRLQTVSKRVHESVHNSPLLLNALRGLRAVVDVLAIIATLYVVGFNIYAVFFVPLIVGVVDDVFRAMCQQYVSTYRAGLVRQHKENVRELIQVAYIDSLLKMPASSGRELYVLSRLAEQLPRDLAALLRESAKGGRR